MWSPCFRRWIRSWLWRRRWLRRTRPPRRRCSHRLRSRRPRFAPAQRRCRGERWPQSRPVDVGSVSCACSLWSPPVNDMRKPMFLRNLAHVWSKCFVANAAPIWRMCSLHDTLCTGRAHGEFAELFAAAEVFAAACVDGDRRLTDIATREIFPMHAGKFVSSFALDTSRNVGSDACLRPTNRSRS